ncbi:hypothetical protein L6164_009798 [Bauhinia variegata]|uniref:Uncharacterized protein n=1 Tax=Bauhinia variegata TaxID=167791 RepID=A0ACB9PKU0_BAUVA|nr:hypothetical protein L6164_009798 [Bauhinia variegata]
MTEKNPSLDIQLPPGFRFHPSDEELIVHYLRNKVTSCPLPASFIAEIDLYKFNPWELPSKSLFGEDEWFFFTPRDRKYPNGVRPNRAAGSGYWKATGADKPILTSCGMKSIGVKKALVFYKGRPPKGSKTDWIMHEYRLLDSMILKSKQRRSMSMRLDDWVLCRVRQKIGSPRSTWEDSSESNHDPASYFQQMNINPYAEQVKNPMQNEFPMLPYILATQSSLPSIGIASNIIVQSSASVHEENSNKIEAQFLASATESLFNPLKRTAMEENQLEFYYPPYKKLSTGQDEKDKRVEITLSKGCNFNNYDQWSSIIEPQDLTNLLAWSFQDI